MLSQWSMSEHDGVLRVASTTSPPWRRRLAAGRQRELRHRARTDGDRLRAVGPGRWPRPRRATSTPSASSATSATWSRSARSTRCTSLDLSDPTAPRAVGRAEDPRATRPICTRSGAGLLLGVGREASATASRAGVQASLFDVSDPAQPRSGSTARTSGAARLPRSSTTTTPSRGSTTPTWRCCRSTPTCDGSAGDEALLAGLRVRPGGGDPLGRVAKPGFGGGVRRTLELGGRIYAVGPRGDRQLRPVDDGAAGPARLLSQRSPGRTHGASSGEARNSAPRVIALLP